MVPILLSYMDKPLDKYTKYEMQILVHHLICYVLVMTIQVRHVEAICKDPFFHPFTGGNRAMVAAATIVIMAAADGERISIFPLMCPNKARCVSFSAPDI